MKKFHGADWVRRILILTLCGLLIALPMGGCDKEPAMVVEDGNLVVELGGNPTTGYTWVYQMSGEGIIQEIANTYIMPSDSDLVGAGGTFRFEFEAIAPGDVGLQFSYLRTFQENSTISTVNYLVRVDENLRITVYQDDTVASGSDTDSKIIAGSTFIQTITFGETTEDVVLTWNLCNAGFYIGVDAEYLEWSYADGYDRITPITGNDADALVGTSILAHRYRDTGITAEEYTAKFIDGQTMFTDTTKVETELGGIPAYSVECSSTENGVTATFYFVDVENDVIELAVFCEGSNADDIGARLYAMVETVVINENVGIIE